MAVKLRSGVKTPTPTPSPQGGGEMRGLSQSIKLLKLLTFSSIKAAFAAFSYTMCESGSLKGEG